MVAAVVARCGEKSQPDLDGDEGQSVFTIDFPTCSLVRLVLAAAGCREFGATGHAERRMLGLACVMASRSPQSVVVLAPPTYLLHHSPN